MKNQAFGYLKPHVMSCQAVVTAVGDRFELGNVHLTDMTRLDGSTVAKNGWFDRQNGLVAQYALTRNVSTLPWTDDAKRIFRDSFSEDLDEVIAKQRLVFPYDAMDRLGPMSEDGLLGLWTHFGAAEILPNLFIGRLEKPHQHDHCDCGHHHETNEHHDCTCHDEALYVVNGFYPALRKPYADPKGPGVMTFLLDFDQSWQDFNEVIIGDEQPAGALEESIRGFLWDRRDSLGVRIDWFDNIIHASRSPFEALCDKLVWCPEDLFSKDPLFQEASKAGYSKDQIQQTAFRLRNEGFGESLIGLDTDSVIPAFLEMFHS